MHAIIATVQFMFYSDGAHAALAAITLDVARKVTPGAKKQLSPVLLEAGTCAAILLANTFIFWAILDKHLLTRPYTAYY